MVTKQRGTTAATSAAANELTIQSVMGLCPDHEWPALFTLQQPVARYANGDLSWAQQAPTLRNAQNVIMLTPACGIIFDAEGAKTLGLSARSELAEGAHIKWPGDEAFAYSP